MKNLLSPWYEEDACLIEKVHGEADDGEGDGIGSGSDDGCNKEDSHDGVATVLLHLSAMEDAEATKEPGEDGDFEDDAHGEGEEGEGVDVALKRDEVLDGVIDLIASEEAEGDGEEDKVGEEDSEHEHEIGGDDEWSGIASLVFV